MTKNQAGVAKWFSPLAPARPEATIKLFCFPYAGGSSAFFHAWGRRLPTFVEAHVALLPGRGSRLAEAPFSRLSETVEAVAAQIVAHLDRPFAFFGHSMGAMISFELARCLRRERGLEPAHLFVSGSRAPQLPDKTRHLYDLPDAELIEELRRLDGTPGEVLEHPELMQLMLPLLRADFAASQTHVYTDEPPLGCPITVFGGADDEETPPAELGPWREQTTSPAFNLRVFPGGHFFIHTAQDEVLEMIAQDLRRWAAESALID